MRLHSRLKTNSRKIVYSTVNKQHFSVTLIYFIKMERKKLNNHREYSSKKKKKNTSVITATRSSKSKRLPSIKEQYLIWNTGLQQRIHTHARKCWDGVIFRKSQCEQAKKDKSDKHLRPFYMGDAPHPPTGRPQNLRHLFYVLTHYRCLVP